MKSATLATCALALLAAASLRAQNNNSIVQSGFDAFSHGTFGNGGQNLYVSHAGTLQTINQWDINRDGYNDVLISNDHDMDETVDAFIYWNQGKGFKSLMPDLWQRGPLAHVVSDLQDNHSGMTRLPTLGGGRAIVADLNNDGYPDIVFCNYIHNTPGIRTAYIYWGGPDGFNPTHRTELPTNWAYGVAAADLNGDGYPDLVFANEGAEAGIENLAPDKGLSSYIYWGSATGFDVNRRALLPTHGARDVVIADVNHDGHPDIAFINNSPSGKSVQVFLGSASGFSEKATQTIPLENAAAIRAADVNNDGIADLLVATETNFSTAPGAIGKRTGKLQNNVYVYLGGPNGVSPDRKLTLPALDPNDMAVGDFNHDGFADVAIANSSDGVSAAVPSYVYWGSAHGFDTAHRTELPTLSATGVVAADLNGDGFPDLAFSNYDDDKTYDVPSYIYWGSATGFAPYLRSEVQGFGAVSVVAADLKRDGRQDLILVNQASGNFGGNDTNIFWGNPHHYYSSASMASVPGYGTYGTTVADLNNDGYNDLVLDGSYHHGTWLYYGGPNGFATDKHVTLPVDIAYTSAAADLNHDGFLDLVFGAVENGKPVGDILWGSANGYSADKETKLPLNVTRNATVRVADLNHDGFLDLIFTDNYFGEMRIFWGGKDGYSEARVWKGNLGLGGVTQLADLNGDGNLDFIITGSFDPVRKSRNTFSRIYWGNPDGTPSLKNPIELEAYQSEDCAIADLNHDGYLDLVFSNYMSDSTRELPLFIYWGGKDGYSNARRTDLPAESSAGIETVDLNGDGYPEIIVHNHVKDGRHTIPSWIYWNGPNGFDKDHRTELPGFGPHFTQQVNPGNLYSRKLEEEYISAPLEIPSSAHLDRITWKGEEPHGARLKFQIRSASDKQSLAQARWIGPEGPASFYVQSGTALKGMADHGWIQYRVLFTSPDAASWPTLTQVELSHR
ncbi:MAG: VCBS repeat-containing protein [Acidobacteriota bacterium]